MERSCRNSDELPRLHHQLAIGKFDDQLAVHPEERFIGVRMPVPAELLRHHAHPDFVVIDLTEGDVLVRLEQRLAERERIDEDRRAISHARQLAGLRWGR